MRIAVAEKSCLSCYKHKCCFLAFVKRSDSAGLMKALSHSAPDSEGTSEGEDERQGYSPDNLVLITGNSDAFWQQASFTICLYRPAPFQWPRSFLCSTEKTPKDRTSLMNNIFSQIRNVDTSDTWPQQLLRTLVQPDTSQFRESTLCEDPGR